MIRKDRPYDKTVGDSDYEQLFCWKSNRGLRFTDKKRCVKADRGFVAACQLIEIELIRKTFTTLVHCATEFLTKTAGQKPDIHVHVALPEYLTEAVALVRQAQKVGITLDDLHQFIEHKGAE